MLRRAERRQPVADPARGVVEDPEEQQEPEAQEGGRRRRGGPGRDHEGQGREGRGHEEQPDVPPGGAPHLDVGQAADQVVVEPHDARQGPQVKGVGRELAEDEARPRQPPGQRDVERAGAALLGEGAHGHHRHQHQQRVGDVRVVVLEVGDLGRDEDVEEEDPGQDEVGSGDGVGLRRRHQGPQLAAQDVQPVHGAASTSSVGSAPTARRKAPSSSSSAAIPAVEPS